MLFKNRAIQVKFVKEAPSEEASTTSIIDTRDLQRFIEGRVLHTTSENLAGGLELIEQNPVDKINEVIKDQVRHTALAIVSVYAAITVFKVIGKVIINVTTPRH